MKKRGKENVILKEKSHQSWLCPKLKTKVIVFWKCIFVHS